MLTWPVPELDGQPAPQKKLLSRENMIFLHGAFSV